MSLTTARTTDFSRPSLLPAARAALSFLGQQGLILGLLGASVAALTCLASGHTPPVALLVTVFAIVIPSYGIDRLFDVARDSAAYPERAALYRRRRRVLAAVYAGLVALSIGAASTQGTWAVLAVLGFPLSVVLYVMPVLPRGFSLRRVKDIPYGKGIYSSLCWVGPALIATRWVGTPVGATLAVTALYVFAQLYLTSVVCDLKDEEGDRLAGVRTLPVAFGRARTVEILRTINLVSLMLGAAAVLAGVWDGRALVAVVASSLLTAAYLRDLDAPRADLRFTGDVICDGVLAVWLAIALLLG